MGGASDVLSADRAPRTGDTSSRAAAASITNVSNLLIVCSFPTLAQLKEVVGASSPVILNGAYWKENGKIRKRLSRIRPEASLAVAYNNDPPTTS
jgi:hypothetical protein